MTHEAATTVRELPEALPLGESVLWQGAPDWRSLHRRAFHGRTLLVYFAGMLVLRGVFAWASTESAARALIAMAWLAPVAAFAIGVVTLLAWLTARATWYTITDHRVVMRIGIVLEVTFNFPFKVIDTVDVHRYADGTGELALGFMPGERIAYLHLWPHARPWRLARPQPMLRCVPDIASVSVLLSNAMREHSARFTSSTTDNVRPSAHTDRTPNRQPVAAAG